ncbi:MAG: hypothetical protein ACUVSY_14860 [Roseiflexus sp.]
MTASTSTDKAVHRRESVTSAATRRPYDRLPAWAPDGLPTAAPFVAAGERTRYEALLTPSSTSSATPSVTSPFPDTATSTLVAASPMIAIKIGAGVLMMIAAVWIGVRSRRRTPHSNADDSSAEWSYDI